MVAISLFNLSIIIANIIVILTIVNNLNNYTTRYNTVSEDLCLTFFCMQNGVLRLVLTQIKRVDCIESKLNGLYVIRVSYKEIFLSSPL